MRKVLPFVMGFLLPLVTLVGITASVPAYAACYGYTVKGDGMTIPYGTVNAEWRATVTLEYRPCDNGSYGERYIVSIIPKGDGGNCFRIDDWKVNPNILGNYNPGTRILDCHGQEKRTAIWDLHSEWVPRNAPDNDRCLGAHVTVGYIGASDPGFNLPSLCLPR